MANVNASPSTIAMHQQSLPRSTQRISLRRLAPPDLAAFQAYRHDAELGRYQGWEPLSDEAAAQFILAMSQAALFAPGEWLQLGIAEWPGDALIGDIGIFIAQDAASAEIGFTLAAKAQGQGLASEAVRETIALLFECTGVQTIAATTDQRNTASIKLLERIGMQRVATVETVFRGQACTEYGYAARRP
jgi:RimJ/RimL family protein N-acetyltransferase